MTSERDDATRDEESNDVDGRKDEKLSARHQHFCSDGPSGRGHENQRTQGVSYQIFVTLLVQKKIITLNVSPSDTISDIKTMIQEREGIPPTYQRLTLNQKPLDQHDARTLQECNIHHESNLHLLASLYDVSAKTKSEVLFVKTLPGKVVAIPLDPHDTGSDIKAKFEKKEGVPAYLQRLIFRGGRELKDSETCSDLAVQYNYEMFLILRLSKSPLLVKTLFGKQITLEYNPHDTVFDIKTKLELTEGHPPDVQHLYFAGRELKDNKTLSDCGVQYGSTLILVLIFGHNDER